MTRSNETIVAFPRNVLVEEIAESSRCYIERWVAIDEAFGSIIRDRINPATIADDTLELSLDRVQADSILEALQHTSDHLNDGKRYEEADKARPVLAKQAAAIIKKAMLPDVRPQIPAV